jgi:hypothetical protein
VIEMGEYVMRFSLGDFLGGQIDKITIEIEGQPVMSINTRNLMLSGEILTRKYDDIMEKAEKSK